MEKSSSRSVDPLRCDLDPAGGDAACCAAGRWRTLGGSVELRGSGGSRLRRDPGGSEAETTPASTRGPRRKRGSEDVKGMVNHRQGAQSVVRSSARSVHAVRTAVNALRLKGMQTLVARHDDRPANSRRQRRQWPHRTSSEGGPVVPERPAGRVQRRLQIVRSCLIRQKLQRATCRHPSHQDRRIAVLAAAA